MPAVTADAPLEDRTTTGRGRRYLAYRTGSGARWVLPKRYRHRLTGVGMYVPYSLGGYARKLLMLLGLAGARVDSQDDPIGELEPLVFEALGREDVSLAWYVGNRRAETKTSALAVDANGRAVAFAKLAMTPPARRSLERERTNLEALEAAFDGAPPAPRPLAWRADTTASVLITTAAPPSRAPRRFDTRHQRFLARLQAPFNRTVRFTATPLWKAASEFMDRRCDRASEAWRARFTRTFDQLAATLAEETITTSLAHRDFAPWNTRMADDGLFAFDWEFASTGYPTLHDYFHFHFMVGLLLDGGVSLDQARGWLQRAPERERHMPHLLVAYLLDVARQYHGFYEGSTDVPDDPVLRQAARLLDGVDQWLSS